MKENTNFVNNTSDMQKILDSSDSSINVQNGDSDFCRFYHMNVPFQLTLEYCSGSAPEDYVNVVTLSFEKAVMYQESLAMKNYSYTKNAPHFHDFFEFVVVLDGTIVQKIEGKEYLYPAGSCCLINRNLRHMERYQSQCRVLFIGLSPAFVTELFDSAQSAYFANEKKICGLLCAFISELSSQAHYHCTNIQLDTNSDFLLFSRITRLFEESDGRMTRAEMEQFLHYSGDYLNRIVNKFTGMCFYDYGMTFCLKKAAQCLTETEESISTIAARLKFTNRTHFYSLFKEKYGMTPKEYRKLHS